MRADVEAARVCFRHPSQHSHGLTEADLPDDGIYYVVDGVCLAFGPFLWPGMFAAHVAVEPRMWGKVEAPALECLNEFWADFEPDTVVMAVNTNNRKAVSLAKRVGAVSRGVIGALDMMEWRPK